MTKTTLETLAEKIEALNREIKDKFEAALKEESVKLFDKYSDLEGIGWRQYTPYFNDGEPCEFSAHLSSPDIEFDGNVYGDYADEGTYELTDQEMVKDVEKFTKSLYPFESSLQRILGEGRVRLRKDGIDVEDHDHD